MIITTSTLQGKEIVSYDGLVTGETIIGANIFKDFFAGIRDIIGGRSGSYERVLREAKDIAIAEMTQQAKAKGADGIIGVDLDYESISSGSGTSMLMVTASGTAVKIK